MRSLDRKLIRDLLQLKGQILAISLVIACGVATFVMSLGTLTSLKRTQETYYERYRFAHIFTHLKRAPEQLALRIQEIPGVNQVQTRIVIHAVLDIPGSIEPAVGRFVSIPDQERAILNDIHLRAGRYIHSSRENEILVSEGFASAHRLSLGSKIAAIINGRKQTFQIVGIAISPEYIYQIREGELLPDDRRFGVFWMGRSPLEAAYDMKGAFNDLALTISPEALEPEVIRRLDLLTKPFGGLGAYGRSDQSSHKFVNNEMNELRGVGAFIPAIFLGVAGFLLNVVISRMIGTQREQIATLKAFGYTSFEIAIHYLKMVVLIVLIGVICGTLLGAWLGQSLTKLYTQFFRFPVFDFYLDPAIVLIALLVSIGAGILGTIMVIRKAIRIPPAEAMQPEAPANFRPTWFDRIRLNRILPPTIGMILRQIHRRPLKTFLTILGIALATAVVILGSFSLDAINYALDAQYFVSQRQDMLVSFIEPSSSSILSEIEHLPGVSFVEPIRSLAVRLRAGQYSRQIGILGLPFDANLYRVMDIHCQPIPLPSEGIVLSKKLGELLNLRIGDPVTIEVLEGERPIRETIVRGLVEDFAGTSAYMEIFAVNRLMREGHVVTGAFLSADSLRHEELYLDLKNTPRVGAVTIKMDAIRSFRQTIAENLLRMRLFNILFASVIACGVVYNSARISLSERSRDLATLRILGFTRTEVSFILLGELALLTLIAIPIGFGIGYLLAYFIIESAYNTELFRLPLIIDRWTFGFAGVITLSAAVFSGFLVHRRIDRLDLITVLKNRG